ncbi:MAG: galactokinase [Lachnospiraceae bacterium]|uniref:Galactokinase n=1 Tax=Candidatus Weimeria bifida TaxID=2599074 RepID=A0A6N7IXD5_9FIRM|nr:galactokinase [Candidatus Weimeria bifida]RRF97146.1 MAG: galactokinase [Lachnospiraceae bacterium]
MVKDEVFERVYGENAAGAKKRFEHLEEGFKGEFGSNEGLSYFTAPGRTEIIGNHTDHNGGKVIAASINLDTIGAACVSGDETVEILSEGYRKVVIDINDIESVPKEEGTLSLVAGMIEAAKKKGYEVHGFKAYVTTTVIPAAGVSSSASFEMLFCAMINHFFNDDKIPVTDYAKIGQYSENNFWNKSSGLMDQMACAYGGPILLDFKGDISVEKIPFSFGDFGYEMVITNTGKGHADLSADYSSIPQEMFAVAKALGGERLCDVTKADLLADLNKVEETVGNDRAILRAFHFFNETQRVADTATAVKEKDFGKILSLLKASGDSSYKLNQNCYTISDWKEQKISLALALTEEYLAKTRKGICRVHGGGFAGVIMCVLPKEETAGYVDFMAEYFGRENVYPMNIRQTGAVYLG